MAVAPSSEQRSQEMSALSRLAFDELAAASGGIGNVHRAIADRVFGAVVGGLGPTARPARIAHDAISAAAYSAVGSATRLLGEGAALALGRRPGDAPPPSATPLGAVLVGALQGLRGDALEAEGSPLAPSISVRIGGAPVPLVPPALAAAFPDATPRLAVFLPGLMETEGAWGIGGRPTYGERLRADLGITAVLVRYNTGRHISENGRALAELLATLMAAWPVEVEEIALVGHSMGGLVARSACFLAAEEDAAWVGQVHHVVSLGTPHLGAPLEQAVHSAATALHAVPETRPFGRLLRRRSAGIRDLRHGSLVDEDWQDRDPDGLRAASCREVPLLDHVTHCFVSATVTRSPSHPVGRLVGDLLVLAPSASGRGRTRRIPFRDEDGLHVGPATHFALLNHPAVYARLRDWLAQTP